MKNPKDYINSNDIEIAQLNVNILLQQGMNIIHIEDLLKKTQYEVELFDRKYIILKQNWMYESMKMMEESMKMMENIKAQEHQLMWRNSPVKYGKK